MNILTTNDDGFGLGVTALIQAIKTHKDLANANILTVIPDRDRSGSGAAISAKTNLTTTKVSDGLLLCSGTPVDCVHLGGYLLKEPNLLISGINIGPNLADDWLYSGTIGAALEANRIGVKSIAISYCGSLESMERNEQELIEVIHKILDAALVQVPGRVYSFNIPDLDHHKDPNIVYSLNSTRFHEFSIKDLGNGEYKIGPIGGFKNINESQDSNVIERGDISLTAFNY